MKLPTKYDEFDAILVKIFCRPPQADGAQHWNGSRNVYDNYETTMAVISILKFNSISSYIPVT